MFAVALVAVLLSNADLGGSKPSSLLEEGAKRREARAREQARQATEPPISAEAPTDEEPASSSERRALLDGDAYCNARREDAIAALEIGSEDTVNSPRHLRLATRRLLTDHALAPPDAWCVNQEVEFLIDVWNGYRGDDRAPDAGRQVRALRKFERR